LSASGAGSEKSALLGIALAINDFARIPVTAASQGRVEASGIELVNTELVSGEQLPTLVLTSHRSSVILGLFDVLVDIGAPAEKEVIQ
jgi:hypothetical protein